MRDEALLSGNRSRDGLESETRWKWIRPKAISVMMVPVSLGHGGPIAAEPINIYRQAARTSNKLQVQHDWLKIKI